jgi:hypothetical protein
MALQINGPLSLPGGISYEEAYVRICRYDINRDGPCVITLAWYSSKAHRLANKDDTMPIPDRLCSIPCQYSDLRMDEQATNTVLAYNLAKAALQETLGEPYTISDAQ